jgi:pyruvate carboxylase
MQVCIDAVREAGKVAEVAICYTSDFTVSEIYTLEYYKDLAVRVTQAGAHVIALKDMAGLLKPQHAKPLIEAIKSVTEVRITRRAHKYFPVHRAGANTAHWSRSCRSTTTATTPPRPTSPPSSRSPPRAATSSTASLEHFSAV